MSQPVDIGGKRLISLAPDNWVKWVTQLPQVQVQEFLAPEFQWVSRENDVLLKVHSAEAGEFLVLNELQLRYNSHLPRRIRAYSALAEERYRLPIYPVLVNIVPPSANPRIPTCYESEFQGIRAYQDYRVINLWEVKVELVFEQQIRSLLPFVPILKGGGEEEVVRTALRELRADEELNELEPLLSFFASFVLELPVVRQIMRWDMAVLRESPWYREILKEGEQIGEQRGRQAGEAELVLRQLSRRLGRLDEAVQRQIRQLDIAQLEELGEQLLDFSSAEELRGWLEQQPRP